MTYSANLCHKNTHNHTTRIKLICTPLVMSQSSLRRSGRRSSEVE